ncbi:helix-turn-helix domain-containing protein [Herbiconiux moechotypicola]|uniref:Sugar-binding transcriptional regulator n=1 Tax=Herbiconiux moechotypicola TaxID=637393 RepID=A0ABN3E8F0_9MICO|nr:sugar-binding domain-containing protein [Herbiconiux moechotypicola]MCS5732077.1 helix-turn-helix domain-containing protein [Herbiconiux moechotypicola]
MQSRDPLSLIVHAAQLYHEQGLTQPEIAETLGVSQSRVSRWLKDAVERGIVRTVVFPPQGVFPEIEGRVRDRYGLRHVVVADARGDEQAILPALGSAASIYLESTLASGARVGISSYSAFVKAAVESMMPLRKRRLDKIVQVMGGVGRPDVQILATQTADRFARLTGADPVFLPAPGVVSQAATREALFKDDLVHVVAREWNALTDVLVGIGSLTPSPLIESSGNAVPEADIARLRSLGAVGDVAMRFFAADGSRIISELDERVIGISADQLRAVPRRIGIAGGARKLEAVRAAVSGGWIDVLITDAETGEALAR